jgi:hypothetical protein
MKNLLSFVSIARGERRLAALRRAKPNEGGFQFAAIIADETPPIPESCV